MSWFFDSDERRDSRRAFTQTQKANILYQQNNKCAVCKNSLDPRAIEFDHEKPWADAGRTVTWNGRALCPNCHAVVTHEQNLRKVQGKGPKIANPEADGLRSKLDSLSLSQLKFLAKVKKVKVRGRVEEGFFEDTQLAPSKKQYIKAVVKLFKSSEEVDQCLANMPIAAKKKKKRREASSWW